ncbi:MAG: hypothetical protein MR038_07620 [Oscillospiraceae bacterium]|nr:hypothetical protein [Oscillospiraceae bacterium]
MDNEKIKEMIKRLDGISYHEWKKLAYIMDNAFERKKGEIERDLKLSSDDKAIIQLQSELM